MMTMRQTDALRTAAHQASLAPSIHNTQPWRFALGAETLEIHADRTRRLRVLDPHGRQLTLSCGCALFNARVALAAAGYAASVARLPDPADPDLLARIGIDLCRPPGHRLVRLDPMIETRQTNRRAFTDEHVPDEVVELLVDAARREEVTALPVVREEDRMALARLSQLAEREELVDPAYRAELRAWTSTDPDRLDGVPASAVPHVDAGAQDDLPIRDFDTHGAGGLPTETRSSVKQCLLLLCTDEDTPASWLRAGEALERVLLEITRHGYAVSPFTQVIEVAYTNALLRSELRLAGYPHILLRIGHAPPTPRTRRRLLADMLHERR
jgi:hypothetical protein